MRETTDKKKKKQNSRCCRKRLIAAGILLLMSGALWLDAKGNGPFFRCFCPKGSFAVLSVLGKISSLFPFSVLEVLVTLLAAGALLNFGLIFFGSQRKNEQDSTNIEQKTVRDGIFRWISTVLCVCAAFLFAFTFLWGTNHFGEDLYTKLGLTPRDYTVQDLLDAGIYCAEMAEEAAGKLPETEVGTTRMPSFEALAASAQKGFVPLNASCPEIFLPGSAPKPLLYSELFSYMGFTGFYFAFTGEACVNRNTFSAALPHTMCHELAHSSCIASEDEANFAGFLACLGSEDPAFRYSAWYMGYLWCGNSLWRIDRDAYRELAAHCGPRLRADLGATNTHYEKYDGKVQEAAQSVNDAYLKLYNEELGVESYGAAVSYFVNWYLQTKASATDASPVL